MGNCLRCPFWRKNRSKHEFDLDNHITIEAKAETVDEMKEIENQDNNSLHEIEFGQQISIENMNCTEFPKRDELSLEEIKEQKDIDNMTIKKMSDSAKLTPEGYDQSDNEEEKNKTRSPSLSSKTTSLEESQRSTHHEDENISTKPDLVKITLDESQTENSKEENIKETTEDLTLEQEVYKELEIKLTEAMDDEDLKQNNSNSGVLSLEVAQQENFRSSFHILPTHF